MRQHIAGSIDKVSQGHRLSLSPPLYRKCAASLLPQGPSKRGSNHKKNIHEEWLIYNLNDN